ncbi:glycerol-3-phosphate acyltransferase 2 [Thermacetogenium phaeum DSM 12270]|uniref:Glycerol-3-phosphate acyltransferase n=1 Tax=Thermacetogenium phaeum (strain ATCC BAA-254 / DSM 26808 / PB) TaxID=1089553 RepID=K4LUR6_THEPS|nr:glycerol-3-phosphate 1-O-acyltransferase PlsY [Thermacetogenium phaeum]AFV11764.1 glycerol-3-phosphate acyltransferase 2 [Thermacetogenium phaeum DSM 12270]
MQVLLLLGSYLIGSIPCGYLVGRKYRVDIRRYGSGNIGATNAFRVLGPRVGLLVLLCDAAKGFFPVLIINHFFGPAWAVMAGLATMAGHNWSLFLGFRGGRGVATGAGVVLALMPGVVAVALVIWLAVVLITGYVSLASIFAALFVPLIAFFFKVPPLYYLFAIPAPLIVVYRHLPNIRRLQKGTEPRIRFR